MRYALIAALVLFAIPAFAAGTCPATAQYISLTNPTGALVALTASTASGGYGLTGCWFVSTSGSDSNAGTTEGAPFAHVRGMPTCTANCAAASTSAGIGWILKGGDTWTAGNFPFVFPGSGNSTNRVYVGIGFSGTALTRPIFDCQNTQCGSVAQIKIDGGSFVTIDNIESTGQKSNTNYQKFIENVGGDQNIILRNYTHGWSHGGTYDDTGNESSFSDNTSTHSKWMFNVSDGFDTSKDMKNCFRAGGDVVAYNVCNFNYEGLHGHVDDAHGNNFGNFVLDTHVCQTCGDHANAIVNTPKIAIGLLYNNVVHDDVHNSGMEDIWMCGAGTAGSGYTGTYWTFGNVTYNLDRAVEVGDHDPVGCGTVNFYNNTIQNGANYCVGQGVANVRSTVNFANNHCIIPSGTVCLNTGATCNNLGNNLQQTQAQANANITPKFDQYNASTTYAYSPAASTNSTVAAGQNLSAQCTGVVAPLCNDTTYAIYNATNHTVVLRSVHARGSSWDEGAFQFTTASGPGFSASPNPVVFGNVNVSSTGGPTTVTVTNTGTTNLVITSVTSNNARFPVSANTCATVGAGLTCHFAVSFSPLAPGAQSATITVADNVGNPDTVQATGTGIAVGPGVSLTCNGQPCTSVGFGAQIINTTSAGAVVTLTNSGNALLTITSINLTTGTQFAKSTNCTGTLVAGLNCTITVTFTPTSGGAQSDSLVITTDAPSSPDSVALSGTGATIAHVPNACSTAGHVFSATNSFTDTCVPNKAGDAITLAALCHDSTNHAIPTISVTAPGYTIFQRVPATPTGLGGVGALFGTIAIDTNPVTFTFTFTGAVNCTTFGGYLTDEWSGNDPTGGASTFNVAGSSGGAAGGCTQPGASLTPSLANEAVWFACFDDTTGVAGSYTQGSIDLVGDSGGYLIAPTQGVPLTPAFANSTDFYVVMGTGISSSPAQVPKPPGPAVNMMLSQR